MEREIFIKTCDEKLKLVRTEFNLNQEAMAYVLGCSKKTLVEIEKGRSSLHWTGAVMICTIFEQSEILAAVFGGNPKDIVMALAFRNYEPQHPKTMGGKIWWKNIKTNEKYKIQQNIISKHYRILDEHDRRICASFDLNWIQQRFEEMDGF